MAIFIQKRITHGQSLADHLKRTRLEKKSSLVEAADSIGVQIKYLEYFESGEYQKLPGDMYARAWLKLYGEYLDLPTDQLLSQYKVEKGISDKLKKVEEHQKKIAFNPLQLLKPLNIKTAAVLVIILGAFTYLGWEVKNILTPPLIVISQPENNLRTDQSSIEIQGSTEPEVQLTINNEVVLLDETGSFSQTVNLVSGLNNLYISAKKKHSKANTYELVILREGI